MLRPKLTARGAPSPDWNAPPWSDLLAETKTALRILSPSDDELVRTLILWSREVIAGQMGRAVDQVALTDYYDRLDSELELTQPAFGGISLKFVAAPAIEAVEVAGAVADTSSPLVTVLHLPDVPVPSAPVLYPLRAEYTAAAYAGRGVEGVNQAQHLLCRHAYFTCGDVPLGGTAPLSVMRAVKWCLSSALADSAGGGH